MNDLATIESSIALIDPDESTVEQMMDVGWKLENLAVAVKAAKVAWKEKVVEYILKHEPFTVGDILYTAGHQKDYECRDVRATAQTILEEHGHEALKNVLASRALKPGAARALLGIEFKNHFDLIEKVVLKEGKPQKQLIAVNEKFLK